MKEFKCRLRDRRYYGDLGQWTVNAANKTEARKVLAKAWARDTPRDARNCGFVPFRDVKIVWEEQDE